MDISHDFSGGGGEGIFKSDKHILNPSDDFEYSEILGDTVLILNP